MNGSIAGRNVRRAAARHAALASAASGVILLAAAGCALTGAWRVAEVQRNRSAEAEGPELNFDISRITFAKDGRYTATERVGGWRTTRTGAFRYSGSMLTLEPDGGEALRLDARKRWGGDLVLTHKQDGQSVTARMTRVEE